MPTAYPSDQQILDDCLRRLATHARAARWTTHGSAQSKRCLLYFHLHSEYAPLSRLGEQHRARL